MTNAPVKFHTTVAVESRQLDPIWYCIGPASCKGCLNMWSTSKQPGGHLAPDLLDLGPATCQLASCRLTRCEWR